MKFKINHKQMRATSVEDINSPNWLVLIATEGKIGF